MTAAVPVRLRRATTADADAAADVYVRARRQAVPDVPRLAPSEDDARTWFAGVVRKGDEVWGAETHGGEIIAVMLLDGDWIEQLYVDPGRTGGGIGSRLLEVAKDSRPNGLQLWTFQSNVRAQRFYERHGFVAADRTDGRGTQERAADVRYVWRPAE